MKQIDEIINDLTDIEDELDMDNMSALADIAKAKKILKNIMFN